MSKFSYKEYDAVGLAKLVREKEVLPKELLAEATKRIEKLNPDLNAVINKMYGREEVVDKDIPNTRPFFGVPILLKDITQEIKGEPITSGSKAFKGYRAMRDSTYVSEVRGTGVVFLGQTNVPEFALMGYTEPVHYGPTKNPWNLRFTPGGSSGGSGAAVASGMVPFAGANDGGGSIRIPAAYCGLFGLKPTRGRTSVGPIYGRNWQGASADHVLTRTVRDSASMLDETRASEKGGAFLAPPYSGSYLKCVMQPSTKKYRIAFTTASPLGTEVHPDCKKGVVKTMELLESMGHEVEEMAAPVDGDKIAKSYLTMYFGEVAATLSTLKGHLGRKAKMSDVEPSTWLLGLIGRATSAEEFVMSLREWDKAAFAMEEFHESYDFYVTPTTAYPPAKIGELRLTPIEKSLIEIIGRLGIGSFLKKTGIVEDIARKNLMRTPFTQLANLTGQPAMSVPMHETSDGLPCGIQFMAARGREDILFELASILEKTDAWIDVRKNQFFSM